MEKASTSYPSVDKPWLKYYTTEDLAIRVPKCTLYQNIYDRNKDYLDDTAILYYGNKITYRKLFSNVEICAKALRKIGIQPGDCVNLCTGGAPEAIYIVLACSRIGAIANFINPLFIKEQMIDRISETGSEWLFVLDAMFSFVESVLPETGIKNVVIIPATNSIPPIASRLLYLKSEARKLMKRRQDKRVFMLWKGFCDFGSSYTGNPDVPYKPETPTIMVYSSGSTGASKGILLTNEGIGATISNYDMSYMPQNRDSFFLQMIPVWFSTGIVYSYLMPLAKGYTVIPELRFSKESFLRDLIKYKPTMTITATSLWIYVANSGKKVDMSRMEFPITGGEKIRPKDEVSINEFLRKNGCRKKFYKGYGMCELGSVISGTTDMSAYKDKQGGCGYPFLGITISAFDLATDKELPCGERGELRVISPAHMKGYYKNPAATAEFFKTDEKGQVWGCTGDIGYLDEDGEVFVLGRVKDHCLRENGEMVFLFDIEAEILKDGAVDQCKAVSYKANGETVIVAHIVFQMDALDQNAALERIHRNLLNTLPEHMIPDFYKARATMPVHTNGKLDAHALRGDRENLIPAQQLS